MTREEAANILSNDIIDGHVEGNARFMEAFWFAVDNLKTEPCEDCVSRAWIREHLGEFLRGCRAERTYEEIAEDVEAYIDHAPPVTPKQRTGKWITQWNVVHQTEYYYCSECREEFSYDGETGIKMNDYDFCPNCGAKMEGESE